ncbi:MAG: ORF6N domain-containing protein [Odoribacter sp.]|nr:ORF6N domain-containing protein [Odoribacter sp.]
MKATEQLQIIRSKIYEIRGQRVMLDKDLAELYQVTTGNLNKSVQRNIKRFPADFMFQLTKEEFDQLKANLIFQNGTSSWGGTRKLPYAFTEQGLAMLSGILNSDTAIYVNINIMRAFVAIRQLISNPPVDKITLLQKEVKELKEYMEEVIADQNDINEDTRQQIELINQALAELQVRNKKQRPRIGFIKYDD